MSGSEHDSVTARDKVRARWSQPPEVRLPGSDLRDLWVAVIVQALDDYCQEIRAGKDMDDSDVCAWLFDDDRISRNSLFNLAGDLHFDLPRFRKQVARIGRAARDMGKVLMNHTNDPRYVMERRMLSQALACLSH